MERRPFVGALLASPLLVRATGQAEPPEARIAVMAWLQRTDAGDHAAAWAGTAAPFKAAVTAAQWQQAAEGVRGPLGAVRERKDKATTFTRTLPGAPDGSYAVMQFDTRFEHKARAVETVTALQETDGLWRVTGYFIR